MSLSGTTGTLGSRSASGAKKPPSEPEAESSSEVSVASHRPDEANAFGGTGYQLSIHVKNTSSVFRVYAVDRGDPGRRRLRIDAHALCSETPPCRDDETLERPEVLDAWGVLRTCRKRTTIRSSKNFQRAYDWRYDSVRSATFAFDPWEVANSPFWRSVSNETQLYTMMNRFTI